MTPKEKADELFDKMMQTISDNCEHSGYCTRKECKWKGIVVCHVIRNEAKQCALICCEEIISAFKQLSIEESGRVPIDFGHGYWEQVKQEIIKL